MSEEQVKAPQKHPRVLISYSHDSPQHSARVLAFAIALRRNGIDVELDQFHQDEILDWPRWCNEQTGRDQSDFVLCVCTPEYFRRIEGKVPPEKGKGVYWEGSLLDDEIYDAKGNRRLLPVLLDDQADTSIPRFLRGWTFCRLSTFALTDSGYEHLLRVITGQLRVTKCPLGAVPVLPTQTLAIWEAAQSTPPLPAEQGNHLPKTGAQAIPQADNGQLLVEQILDVKARRSEVMAAIELNNSRIEPDETYDVAEFTELIEQHLKDNDGWDCYFLIAKRIISSAGENSAELVGALLAYCDLQECLMFISYLVARKPERGGVQPHHISERLVEKLMQTHQACRGTRSELLVLTEVAPPCLTDKEKQQRPWLGRIALIEKEERRRLGRIKLFEKAALKCGIPLRCLELPYIQPKLDLSKDKPEKRQLLLYGAQEVRSAIPKTEAERLLTWLYTRLYSEDIFRNDPREAERYGVYLRSLLRKEISLLPESVRLLRARQLFEEDSNL